MQARDTLTPTNCRGYRVDAVLARELRCGGPQWATSELGRWGKMGAIGRFEATRRTGWVANAPLGSLSTWVTLGYSIVKLLVGSACAKVTCMT